MIDLLFLAHNRLEFTKATLAALFANTDWAQVDRLLIYDDASTDGTREYLAALDYPAERVEFRFAVYGGPVAAMIDYLYRRAPDGACMFAKIDSDTVVPPGWLGVCLRVMEQSPELDLLGIEAFHPTVPAPAPRSYESSRHIGGIGLMRTSAFRSMPRPNGRFGFTEWQLESPDVVKGFINPALPVFLLDHLPREPWTTLSGQYVAAGWQRPWAPYEEERSNLWDWWTA